MSKSKSRHLFDGTRPSLYGATETQTCAIGILLNRPKARKRTGPLTLSMILDAAADLFMQNKPNFHDAKMNKSLFAAKAYENKTTLRLEQNKPKQSQFLYHWLCLLFIIPALCKKSRYINSVLVFRESTVE